MKTVISISLGSTSQDFSFTTRLLGQTLRVRRLGTGGNLAQASRLLRHWDGKADALGLGSLGHGRVGGRFQPAPGYRTRNRSTFRPARKPGS